jgi:hypothetical protein
MHYTVTPVAVNGPPIDRVKSFSWQVSDPRTVKRLCRAVKDGKAITSDGSVLTDALGKTYLQHKINIFGKWMNETLTGWGY